MIKRVLFLFFIVFLGVCCNSVINSDNLYGKWNYIKVEHPDNDPPVIDSLELNNNAASIEFLKNNEYVINWGGKVLSHGRFTVEGKNIHIKETLENGKIREFPFWISELTNKKIVFQTLGADGSKVTAVR